MDDATRNEKDHFLYLNRDGKWSDFARSGLELRQDGSLGLIRLPALDVDLPPELEQLDATDGPAGIAVASDGTIYYTDPARHLLHKIDPCPVPKREDPGSDVREPSPCSGDRPLTGRILKPEQEIPGSPVACLGEKGSQGTQFDGPRGMLYHCIRNTLLVADSGNNRIQLFDSKSYQLRDLWGQEGGQPGNFRQPWSLAGDSLGNIYVVDYGNRRVQKFDRWGNVLPDFWAQLEATLSAKGYALHQPSEVAVGRAWRQEIVYVLDHALHQILVLDVNGRVLRSPFGEDHLQAPMGLAAGDGVVYVGDNTRRKIFQFNPQGVFHGEALRYEGQVAALALDGRGALLVLAHPDLAPLRLSAQGGYTRKGFLWGGPFSNPGPIPQEWHHVKASLQRLKADAHFQLFLYCSSTPEPDPIHSQPESPPWSGGVVVDYLDCLVKAEPAPACERKWVRMPLDAAEGVIQAISTRDLSLGKWEYLSYVWVGAEFSGEGPNSPVLSQIWLEFDHETYLRHLPPIYLEQDRSRRYLGRFLSLFESLYDEVENAIQDLPEHFDPQAASQDVLPWLSGWMGSELEGGWDPSKKRQAIAGAFRLHARRGTVAGLREVVRLFSGVEVRIEEPIQNTAWWSLPPAEDSQIGWDHSVLGFTTTLVPAEAQGAVVGSTAILDGSHLITQEEMGAPLFIDTAHRFIVQIYRGASYSKQAVAKVAAILDREKPAHTHYHICPIQPQLRIGFQARIGIDSIVAGAQNPLALDQMDVSGEGWRLGGELPGHIGESSQLGQTARLAG